MPEIEKEHRNWLRIMEANEKPCKHEFQSVYPIGIQNGDRYYIVICRDCEKTLELGKQECKGLRI